MSFSTNRSASFSDTEIAAIQRWTDEERHNLCLTIWVDSTAMQVALAPVKDSKKAIYQQPIRVSKATDLLETFDSLRSTFGRYRCSVVFATMSFAGPVSQDHVVVTNWKCEARERVIHFTALPFDLFPLDRRRFMNDLEAASYGLIARFVIGCLPQIFSPLWPTDQPISLDGSSLVLSIGFGFGVSFVCRVDASEHNCVVSSEAGHTQAYLCSPTDPKYSLEVMYMQFVSQRLHGGSHAPEWEDFCAQRGLELAYQAIKNMKGTHYQQWPNYDQIRNLAIRKEDPDAVGAFELHYRFVMRAAQSMVLGIQCQRVFIINEVQVQNAPLMKDEKFSEEMQRVFEDHPRSSWFKKIAVFAQRSTSMFPLSGGLFLSRVFALTHQNQSHY